MDFRGQNCTLYPAMWQTTAIRPTEFDPGLPAASFQSALAAELAKAGLNVQMPVPGTPDADLVFRPEIVRADPGNRTTRWMVSGLSGHAIFEAVGQVGGASAPFGQFSGRGVRRWGFYGGDSRTLLNDAARMAGSRAAAQIVAMLAAR
jgi:plastocyanin